jgi:PAS domain S-box-containing protein
MLAVLALVTDQTIRYVERQMRDQLLSTSRLVASALNRTDIKELSFTAADKELAAFARLNARMVDLARAVGIQSIYTQILRDGRIIFGPESIPPESSMASPPGDFYYEAPPELFEAFATGHEVTVGPFTDEYGTFVSAFAPLVDPDTGKVMLVVGVDIDAADWNTDVALRSALPLGLLIVLMVLVSSIVVSWQPVRATNKPAMRLMLPLAAVMVALVCVFGAAMWTQYVSGIQQSQIEQCRSAPTRLEQAVKQQASGMAIALKLLASQPSLHQLLARGDSRALHDAYEEQFRKLRFEGVEHVYFIDAQGVCLARLHNPQKKGDQIDRFTLQEARRIGATAYGIELGTMCNLLLRVVEPVYSEAVEGQERQLLGFVEFSRSIDSLLESTRAETMHLAVMLHKDSVTREVWESTAARHGRPSAWDRFPDDLLVCSTLSEIPREVERCIINDISGKAFENNKVTDSRGRTWYQGISPFTDASGAEIGHLLVINDITDHQTRQARLAVVSITGVVITLTVLFSFLFAMLRRTDRGIVMQRSELERERRRMANVLEGTSAGLWEWNMQTGQTIFNERWAQMIGYTLLELEPLSIKTWERLCHPEDLARSSAAIEQYLAGRTESYICEARMRHKDGSWVWVMDRGKVVEWTAQGEPLRMAGTHLDITAAKTAEIAIEEQRKFLRLIIDQVPSTILVRDQQGHILLANQVLADALGASVDKIEGRRLTDFIDMAGAIDVTLSDDDQVMQTRQMVLIPEQKLTAVDGSSRWFSVVKVPLLEDDHSCTRVLTVATDITNRKQMQDELVALNQQLGTSSRIANALAREAEAASIAKSEFLANMSHEIRTPMTAILGFADLLAETDDMPREQLDEYVATIKRNGEHLLSIINDILDLSKIEAGKMTVESLATDPVQVLQDVMGLMQVKASAKNLDLRLATGHTLPRSIQSDPVRLRQILVNLVGNAIKFTESGSITVTPSMDLSVPAHPKLRIQIADTGIGMTSEQMSRLFGAFEQADASTTRRYGGTGLGLRISKRLATLLGGDISVASEFGKGTTFCLSVATGPGATVSAPVQAAKPTPGACATGATGPSLKGLRVLLADDGPDNLKLVSFLLRHAGAQVHTVINGQQAVEFLTVDHTLEGGLISPPPIDLVLTDMQMPIMDGYTATRTLRQKGCTLPIIALTAHSMSSDQTRCLDAGCNGYATKPINRNALLQTCLKWWRQGEVAATPTQASPHPQAGAAAQELRSDLTDDPVVGPVISQFVQALPERIAELTKLLNEHQFTELARFAHQIKGAAGGFGFPSITEAAGELEQSAKAADDLDDLKRRLDELTQLTQAAAAGVQSAAPAAAVTQPDQAPP